MMETARAAAPSSLSKAQATAAQSLTENAAAPGVTNNDLRQ
jgi:hypothetical protein